MNKPPEIHLHSGQAGRGDQLDPWSEFLSEGPGNLQPDPGDEFVSELAAPPAEPRASDADGVEAGPILRPVEAHAEVAPAVQHDAAPAAGLDPYRPDRSPAVHVPVALDRLDHHAEPEDTISLAAIVGRHVPVHWSEAVALVETLCATLRADGGAAAGAPALDDILVSSVGLVFVRHGARSERDIRNVGHALHALLSTSTTPLPLRLFVISSMSSQRYASVELYAEALALYAEPSADRAELVRALFRRSTGLATAGEAPADDRLTDRPAASRWRAPLAAMAAVAVLTVGAGAAVWQWQVFARAGGPQAAVAPAGVPSPDAAAPVAPDVARRSAAPAADSWMPGPVVVSPARGAAAAFTPALAARAPALLWAMPAEPPAQESDVLAAGVGDTGRDSHVRIEQVDAPAPRATADVTVDPTIYSGADSDVLAPQMLSALMPPSFPGPSSDRVSNTLELVIDERGVVQSVRYVTTPQRLIDTTLLSAVKNVRFRPALKDGAAVKYRLRLIVSSSPI